MLSASGEELEEKTRLQEHWIENSCDRDTRVPMFQRAEVNTDVTGASEEKERTRAGTERKGGDERKSRGETGVKEGECNRKLLSELPMASSQSAQTRRNSRQRGVGGVGGCQEGGEGGRVTLVVCCQRTAGREGTDTRFEQHIGL